MSVWKVKYTDIFTMQARRPFFKHSANVQANSRKEAIQIIAEHWPAPKYRVNSASPTNEQADYWYRQTA